MSLAAWAFPPRLLPQPERKHGCDLLGSWPALGGQGAGDTNRKINGLSFRCFRTEDGEGAGFWAKGVVQPVCSGPCGCCWGVPRSPSGLCLPEPPGQGQAAHRGALPRAGPRVSLLWGLPRGDPYFQEACGVSRRAFWSQAGRVGLGRLSLPSRGGSFSATC